MALVYKDIHTLLHIFIKLKFLGIEGELHVIDNMNHIRRVEIAYYLLFL